MPDPTAVPPRGNFDNFSIDSTISSKQFSNPYFHALISSSTFIGRASIRCVLPVFIRPLDFFAREFVSFMSFFIEGTRWFFIANAVDICIAEGITSFDDCPMFKSSCGSIFKFAISELRFAITSFAFI